MRTWTDLNSLRPRQNGRHFADDIFKCIFLNENVWIPIKIALKFVPKGPINNIPALVQIMPWRRPGDKTLSETMMVILLTHICVTRPQWVKMSCRDWTVSGCFGIVNPRLFHEAIWDVEQTKWPQWWLQDDMHLWLKTICEVTSQLFTMFRWLSLWYR